MDANHGPSVDDALHLDGPAVIPAMDHILKQAAEQRQQAAAESAQQFVSVDQQGHGQSQAQPFTKYGANIPVRGRKAVAGADGLADVHGIPEGNDDVLVPEFRSRSRCIEPSI